MKTIIAIVLFVSLVPLVWTAAPSCKAANYCMGCGTTNADACTMCFNWGTGSVKAKLMTGTAGATGTHCTTAMTTMITDCKQYDGSGSNTTTQNKCLFCASGYFKNLTYTSGTLSAVACSKTAVTLTTACVKIDNCEQVVCSKNTTEAFGCGMCKKGYYNSGTYTSAIGTTAACTKGTNVTNCDMTWQSGTSTHSCYYCKSGYAVNAANDTGCTAYTTDKNCRKLQLDGTTTYCSVCWDAYYWNATVCKLKAGVVVMGAIMALLSLLM